MLNFPLPEEAEKDYLQDVLLRNIYATIGSELLFRGGTAISKIYSSGRFSEDLDFILSSAYVSKAEHILKNIETGIKNANRCKQTPVMLLVHAQHNSYVIIICFDKSRKI